MIITCNECDSSFNVADSLIKETGSKVRCSKCNSVFIAYPEPAEADEEFEATVDDLALESEDDLLSSEEDLGLEDLDSPGDDIWGDEESDETEGLAADTGGELELDLGLDLESEQPDDILARGAEIVETELDLADFDDTPGEEEALGLDGASAVTTGELPDLGDFEELAGLDDEALAGDATGTELADLDFDFEPEGQAGEADLELESGDGLDKEALGFDEEDTSSLELESADDTQDLELDLGLDVDAEAEVGAETAESGLKMEEADALDLSDLEKIFDHEKTPVSEPQAGEPVAEAGLEMEEADALDLSELEVEKAPAAGGDVPEPGAADELDLSGLEEIIESDKTYVPQATTEDTGGDLELDLDLAVDEDTQTADTGIAAADGEGLDFSDLEDMLATDAAPAVETAADQDAAEPDLQIDIEQQLADGAEATATGDVTEAAKGDDLLDIEQMLEEGEAPAVQQQSETIDEDQEMPLEMEAALDEGSAAPEFDLDLDFDLESELKEKEALLDSTSSADEMMQTKVLASDDLDFLDDVGAEEMEFQDGPLESSALPDDFETGDFETGEFTDTRKTNGQTVVLPVAEDEVSTAATAAATVPRSRSKKPLVFILLLFILAIGVAIIPNSLGIKIPYISDLPYISDIQIPHLRELVEKTPYLSDLLKTQVKDVAGNLRITPLGRTINGNFVTNSRAGELFVIRGKIKNEYDHPRSFIKVTSKLYQKGGKVAKKSTVYCGNVLSDSELAKLNIAAINQRLQGRFGDKKSNLKVKAGRTVPFMVVFDKLPQNLDEYTVEVEGSSI